MTASPSTSPSHNEKPPGSCSARVRRPLAAFGLLASVLLPGCVVVPFVSPNPPPDPLEITQRGFARLPLNRNVLDVSVTDLEAEFGAGFELERQTQYCSLGSWQERGLAVVFDQDTALLGVIVADPAYRTAEGIAVGDSIHDITSTYDPDVVAVLDKPSQTGGPLVVISDLAEPTRDPQVETTMHYGFDMNDNGLVTRIRAGFWPWVAYTDYCSDENPRPSQTGWPLIP